MRRLTLTAALLIAGILLVTEAAMQPTPRDRLVLAGIYLLAAVATIGVFLGVRALAGRVSRIATALHLVTAASGAVVAIAVVLAAQTMFLSSHDRNLVLVALLLGLGLGSALALALGDAASRDIERLRELAARVADGHFEAGVAIGRNDEIGALSASLHQMADRLASADQERKVLLASIGHDLRTPLAAMRAQIEAYQDGIVDDPDGVVDGLGRDVEHLSKLVEDLFLFARMEAGTLVMDREPVDLIELADEAVEAMQPLAADRTLAVSGRTGGALVATVDPWALGRVLRNLLDNALRHSPPEGTVSVDVCEEESRPVLRVIDQGPGFPDEIRQTAFDRFTRGDAARRPDRGGTGLGLAIARGIVEAHGGSIAIEDGGGGRVVIRL